MVKPRALNAYLLLLLAFVLGTATGSALTYGMVRKQQAALLDEDGRGLLEARRMHALMRKLDLDEAQKEKIANIFKSSHETKRALDEDIHLRCGERLREHRAQIDGEVRAVLRPDQVERYDELVEKRRERMRKKRGE